jgi:hypothetical protein
MIGSPCWSVRVMIEKRKSRIFFVSAALHGYLTENKMYYRVLILASKPLLSLDYYLSNSIEFLTHSYGDILPGPISIESLQ